MIEGNSQGVEVAYDQLNNKGFMTEEFRSDMLEYGIRFPDWLPGINPGKFFNPTESAEDCPGSVRGLIKKTAPKQTKIIINRKLLSDRQ